MGVLMADSGQNLGVTAGQPQVQDGQPQVPEGLEPLLLDIAVALVDADLGAVDDVLENVLRRVGQFQGVDRAVLFRYDLVARTATNTHEWCAPGVASRRAALTDVSVDRWPEQFARHCRGETVVIGDVDGMPSDDPLKRLFTEIGVVSAASAPLMDTGVCLGFVGFDSYRTQVVWTPTEQRLLSTLARLLVNLDRQVRFQREQDAARALREVNDALGAFAATVSHDLRAPLSSVRGLVELVRSGRVAGVDVEHALDRATANLDRLDAMIRRLLSEALHGNAVRREPVALDGVVEEVREQLDGPIQLRRAEVAVEGPLPTIEADRGQMVQLLQNLIGNALVHVPEDRTPVVRIRCKPDDEAVVLQIVDNGDGLAATSRAAADAGARRGSGLGLVICRRIVAAHGGRLELLDDADGGLAATIRLPLAPAAS